MKFYKMHGIGNDYIYFDCFKDKIFEPEKLAVKLSDRRFGIGGDGIILLCPSDKADIKMRMFNADGSEGRMCGNGIRCLSSLAYGLGYVKNGACTVETLSGIKKVKFNFSGKDIESITVDMGEPLFAAKDIPSTFSGERVVNKPMKVGGKEYKVTLVNMGNPHCVIFQDPDDTDVDGVGKLFESNSAFPERINTEFVKVTGKNRLKMRVYERGSGETFACGTGACAAAVAAVLNGLCERGEEIIVGLLGGELKIRYADTVFMTGTATLVFTGEIRL